MNSFSHAVPYLGRPLFMVGTCLPDWLGAADRHHRVRQTDATRVAGAADTSPEIAEVSRGIIQHHQDDDEFHSNPTFTGLNSEFASSLREAMGAEVGTGPTRFRSFFATHLIIEMLMDAALAKRHPGWLDQFYANLDEIDPDLLDDTVEEISGQRPGQLTNYFHHYRVDRFVHDYARDDGVLYRLNRVLPRVGIRPATDRTLAWMPLARERVEEDLDALLPSKGGG